MTALSPSPGRALALALALAALCPSTAAALTPALGFRAGMSSARLHGSFGDQVGGDYRQDLTVAGYAAFRIGSWISFQPELAWVSKGGEGEVRVGTGGSAQVVDLEHRLHYLEAPLLMRLEAPGTGPFQLYALGGPAPAWRVGEGQTDVNVVGSSAAPRPARPAALIYEDIGTLDSDIRTQAFDLGLVGGLGLWFGRGPVRLGFEGRYTHGLVDVHPSGAAVVRNGTFALTTAIEVR